MPVFQDHTGEKFGKLTVLRRVENKNSRTRWLCQCECGNLTIAYSNMLINGTHKSCGCYKNQRIKELNYKHGQSNARKRGQGTKMYENWKGMKARCYYPKHKDYKYYGAKGITVCDEWVHDYQCFYDWAINNGYEEGLTLDRIDSLKNYCPDNCRWVTWYIQNNNRSVVRRIAIGNETHTISEWAAISGLDRKLIASRVDHHLPVDQLLQPVGKTKRTIKEETDEQDGGI